MAYPTEPTEAIVTIATNTNHSDPGEAWDGQPTKVSPSVGLQATGFTPATPVPPGVFNYLLNMFAKWSTYFQEGFADLQTRISSDEWVYPAGKSRTVRINGTAFCSRASAQADYSGDVVLSESATYYWADIGHLLPTGASLTGVSFRVEPGAARSGSNRVRANWQVISGDSTVDFAGSDTYDDTTSSVQTLTFSIITSVTVDRSKRYRIYIFSGNDAASNNDKILYADITFTDPGPRNF